MWAADERGWLSISPSPERVAEAKARQAERGTGNTIDPSTAWRGHLCEAAFAHLLTVAGVDFEHDGRKNDAPDFTVRGVTVEFKSRGVYSRAVLVRENMADCLVETDAKTTAQAYAFGFYLERSGEVLLAGAITVPRFRAQATRRTHSSKGVALRRPHLSVPLDALSPLLSRSAARQVLARPRK